jgi:septal ring factor EnvC (AmiA/AmiB activator)
VPTILGALAVALVVAYMNINADRMTEGFHNLGDRIATVDKNLGDKITGLDTRVTRLDDRVTRLDEKMNVLSAAMVRQETRLTNLENTVADLRTDLKTLTANFETWRLATARFLPAPGTQSELAANGERPVPSDNTTGAGIPGQDPPASPGEPAPPAG